MRSWAPKRVSFFDTSDQLYVESMAVDEKQIRNHLVKVKKVSGDGTVVFIIPDADKKFNSKLIEDIYSSGLSKIRIIGDAGGDFGYCVIHTEGPPPESGTRNVKNIKLDQKEVIYKNRNCTIQEFSNLVKEESFSVRVEVIGKTTWQELVSLCDSLPQSGNSFDDSPELYLKRQ